MRIYYRLISVFQDIKTFMKAKWFYLFNGFDYRDTWSLDHSLSRWILPRLKYLRKNLQSHPDDMTFEKWQEILDKMIFAFDFVFNESKYDEECYPKDFDWGIVSDERGAFVMKDRRKPDFTEFDKKFKKYEEGIGLFAKYFRHLWD